MKIAIINPIESSKYKVTNRFVEGLQKGLEKLGVEINRIDLKTMDDETIEKIESDNPDLIITFFIYGKNARPLFEKLKTPLLYYSIDGPEYFIDAIKDLDLFLSVRDPNSFDLAHKMGQKKVLLLQHAADNDFSVPITSNRPYDIVFFGTAIPANIGESLLIDYPIQIQEAVLRAVDLNLSNPFSTHYDSLIQSLQMDPRINREMLQTLEIAKLLQLTEMRVRARDKIDLLKAFKAHTVHVFGSGIKEFNSDWKSVADTGNIEFHDEVPFDEALKIMSQSKIVLNSSPTIRFGGHERIYYAYQMGALPFTNFSLFIQKEFKPGENILVYYPPNYNDLDNMASTVLNDETTRAKMVESGRTIVREKHTWDIRAKELLTQLKNFEPFSSR